MLSENRFSNYFLFYFGKKPLENQEERLHFPATPCLATESKLRNLLGSDKEMELALGCQTDQWGAEFSFLLSRWTNEAEDSKASF